jgi:hypothetical protein
MGMDPVPLESSAATIDPAVLTAKQQAESKGYAFLPVETRSSPKPSWREVAGRGGDRTANHKGHNFRLYEEVSFH